jgi:hypothetical protein
MMAEHECLVGLLYETDYAHLATLSDLRVHIGSSKAFNEWCDFYSYDHLKHKVFTLADYADKRKSTDLTRFDFCPMCGKKIDWKAIRRAGNG